MRAPLSGSHPHAVLGAGTLLATMLVVFTTSIVFTHTVQASALAFTPAPADTAVYSYKYNTTRNGWNPNETILNTSNVNTNQFGRLISYPVDGAVYAEPLFVPDVTTPSGTFNLVIVATEHDSVYAFDADRNVTTPIWHTSFLGPNVTSVPTSVAYPGGFQDITPEIGITGTPVIDPATGTLYVDAMTLENGTAVHRLHALDIRTGLDKIAPVIVTGHVAGKGDGSVNGVVTFDPLTANERMSLLLLNGTVYVAYAGFADQYPYHGWIFGYNAQTLQQTVVFNDSPNGGGAGLWDDGNGFVVDPADNSIYVQSGNGTFDANTGGSDYGMSLIHLSTTNGLQVMDYFTPFNYSCLNSLDRDLGSGGAILLPTQSGAHPYEILGGGKEGRIYLMDRTNLGKLAVIANPCNNQTLTNVDNVVQELPVGTVGPGIYSTPALWQGPNGTYVYESANGDFIKAFSLTNGLLSTAPTSQSPETFDFPGENLTVSSDGSTAGTGIVWAITPGSSCPVLDHCNPSGGGALRAYDATNLGVELYSSSQNSARDGLSSYVKFSAPTVANGEVFVGTQNSLDIFGLNPPATPPTPTPSPSPSPSPSPTPPPVAYNNRGVSDDSAPTTGNFDGVNSYSAEALAADHVIPGAAVPVNNAQFIWPNVPAGQADNWQANGQVIPIVPVAGAQTLCFLGSATSGPSSGTATITYTDGTTQTFKLSLSDWALGGGGGTPLPNNTTVLTMPYRNTPNGKQTLNVYVFYTDVALMPGKTIQSVTLPTTTTQGRLHIFAIATTASAALSGSTPPPPASYNNKGITSDSATNLGNFDGVNSYSAQALAAAGVTPGSTFVFNGITFVWPNVPAGIVDNYQAKGQVIAVTPVSGASTIGFLGAATSGPSTAMITLTYTDGSTQTLALAFSDWTLGGNAHPPIASNRIAVTTAYRNTPTGQQNVKAYIFEAELPLAAGKVLQSVTLPTTVSQGTFHIFAISTRAPITQATFNNVGITDDAATAPGNFDGLNSYSAEALAAAGVTPGASVTFNGVAFTWPNVPAGQQDNYQADGQTIMVTPVANATTLAFLGAAANGPSSGTAIITYTDGSTQTFTLGFSDWTLGAGSSAPIAGNDIAITTSYRNLQAGKETVNTDVFYTEVALQGGKTVASVTLPAEVSQGSLHVFAVGTKAATSTTTTTTTTAATTTTQTTVVKSANFIYTRKQRQHWLLPLLRRTLCWWM
jgi:hypothetical protein